MAGLMYDRADASSVRRRRRALLASVLAVALTIVVAMGAAPSYGHSDLASSTPNHGARMERPPAEIQLRFNEDISSEFAQVSLTRDTGSPQRLPVTVRGPLLTASVPRATVASAGGPVQWVVAYRVVSADGHPITGTLEFTAPTVTAVSRTATATPSAPPSPANPAQTDGVDDPLAGPQATEMGSDADENSVTSSRLAVLGIVVAAGLLATVALGFFAARRRRGRA